MKVRGVRKEGEGSCSWSCVLAEKRRCWSFAENVEAKPLRRMQLFWWMESAELRARGEVVAWWKCEAAEFWKICKSLKEPRDIFAERGVLCKHSCYYRCSILDPNTHILCCPWLHNYIYSLFEFYWHLLQGLFPPSSHISNSIFFVWIWFYGLIVEFYMQLRQGPRTSTKKTVQVEGW
jgi:hypothetical protein